MLSSLLGAFTHSTTLTDAKSTRQDVEGPHARYSAAAILTVGQSFINTNSILWDGLNSYVENAAASLKTFVTIKALNPTRLTASAAPSTVVVGQTFTISGTLTNATGGSITQESIQLQRNVSGTWTDVSGKKSVTGAGGAYSIVLSESFAGAYEYRANYTGNAVYAGSHSAPVAVTVKPLTRLTASSTASTVVVGQTFIIYGTLSNASGAPVSRETIQLQRNVSGTWTDVSGKKNTTSAAGTYIIAALNENTLGAYEYRANSRETQSMRGAVVLLSL